MRWGNNSFSYIVRSIIIIAVLGIALVPFVSAYDITGPTKIIAPGSYYLVNDILNCSSSPVIDIQSSGVTLYGLNHIIDGMRVLVLLGLNREVTQVFS